MSLHTVQWLKFKRLILPRTSQDEAALEFSYTTWGNVNGTVFSKKNFCSFIKKVNVYMLYMLQSSVQLHKWQPTRLPRPWDSPGKNTGVGCHFLLHCMKVKSESEVAQSCPTLSNPMDCSLPGSSAHEIFQARVLEWVAIALSAPFPYCLSKKENI